MEEQLVYKIVLTSFIMPFLLAAGIVYFIWRYQKQKSAYEIERRDQLLKEQALIIEKQEAIEKERNRIAGEMHDDLGSGLTTIKYLSDHAVKSATSDKDVEKIQRIAVHANNLVRNMSEIIWAMNSRFDTVSDLSAYMRRYASEYLEEHDKSLTFQREAMTSSIVLSGEKRRAMFLVVKEVLHNFVKYSDSSSFEMTLTTSENEFKIEMLEAGATGFDPAEFAERGNGLFNMQKRMNNIGASFTQSKTAEGMLSTIIYNANQSEIA